ncbi:MAG: NAD(P)-dependent alcohol dehydrogenase [bacterium]|nr:NAD(P)-dependent alcohol dehydrogenase [bacterium]
MKVIAQEKYGSTDVLKYEDIAKPAVKDDEVLVKVHAAGVHIGDWLVMSGLPYLIRIMGYGLSKPKQRVPGTELSGTVAAVGKNVTRFKEGDEVFGWGSAAFAEYVAVAENALVAKPASTSFEQAAAVPISGFTALQAVRDKGEVKPGQKVLVIGASGGVGTYAVQIAKSAGAEVTGVVSTRNLDMVRSIGADHVIDYTNEELTGRYDVIIDTAGNRSLATLRKLLTPQGTLVIVGGSGGRWLMGSSRSLRAMMLSPFVGQQLRTFIASSNQDDLVTLRDLVESGKVTPVIDRTYPLAETAAAIGHVGERHARGKVVITV